MTSNLEDVIEYDPRRPVSFDGSDGRVMLKPSEDASAPLLASIKNFLQSAKDMKNKFNGIPWGER